MDIDFVILWVDGNDPAWQVEKKKYQLNIDNNENTSAKRYRDWGLLPYWFRTVEKFAPWVRKIHFVTWGHIPEFLNVNATKLHVVRHDEFIPAQYLPTFSSHTIEMNIHRIPDLTEHFVYFNDDMFMLRHMSESSFFLNGLPCTNGGEVPIELKGNIGTWKHAVVNDMGIVNAHFSKRNSVKKYHSKYISKNYKWKDNMRTFLMEKIYPDYFTGFKNLHSPCAYVKKTFEDIWREEFDKLDATCRNRFRTSDDVNQWVALWWQVASGQFSPAQVDNFLLEINDELIDDICSVITAQTHDFICVNDGVDNVDVNKLSKQLQDAFEVILPQKSCFEK